MALFHGKPAEIPDRRPQCTRVLVVFVLIDCLSDFRHGLTFDAEVFLDSANKIQYLRMISCPPFIAYVVIRASRFLSDDIPITKSFAYFMKHWKICVRDQEDECQSSSAGWCCRNASFRIEKACEVLVA